MPSSARLRKVLVWHVHGAWTDAFVAGPHAYFVPATGARDDLGRGLCGRHWPRATEVAVRTRPDGRARSKISVVPCGVDVDEFTPWGPTAPTGKAHRIVSVGRLVPRKGFETMIRAMRHIADAELVIVGGPDKSELDSDPEAVRLQQLAAQIGVADRVHLYGSVCREDMPMLLRSADVVAATPWYEPFGIVPLEAMACGVPVVASAVGGMLDTVVDNVTGRHVPPKSPRECADAIAPILWSRHRRTEFGDAGRRRACERYSWERVADGIADIYHSLASADDRGSVRVQVAR